MDVMRPRRPISTEFVLLIVGIAVLFLVGAFMLYVSWGTWMMANATVVSPASGTMTMMMFHHYWWVAPLGSAVVLIVLAALLINANRRTHV